MLGRSAGFSLIEMLAALAVLAIAGLALLNALTTSTRAAALAQDAALAQIAAENLLSQHLLDAPPNAPLREARGEYELAERRYAWRLDVSETGQAGLTRLSLSVSEPESGVELYQLSTLRRTGS